MAELHRWTAIELGDSEGQAHWSAVENAAEVRVWAEYERLIRIPAHVLSDFSYKVKQWERGPGNLAWLRKFKPALAAVLDDELTRLNAEKAERKAAREAKRKEGAA